MGSLKINKIIEMIEIFNEMSQDLKIGKLSEIDKDVLLNDGDTLLVPGISDSVSVFGAVNRPAIYEIASGETILDLINFSLKLS